MSKKYSQLMLFDTDTGKQAQLAEFDYVIEAPFFRTSNELFYNANGLIFSYKLDTGTISKIQTEPCTSCNNDHVLSPDGKLLAVSNSDPDVGSRIYIVDLERNVPARLVTPLAPSYLHGWSPDGKTLAYCAQRNGDYDVYSVLANADSQSANEVRLTDTPGLDDGPEYSPDGKLIYFNSVRGGLMDCWQMDSNGANPKRLTDNGRNNWFPHISPDNSKIVYISYDPKQVAPGDHPADKDVQIRMIRPDGSEDTVLVSFFGGQGSLNVNSWMPDSRHFAFVRYEYR